MEVLRGNRVVYFFYMKIMDSKFWLDIDYSILNKIIKQEKLNKDYKIKTKLLYKSQKKLHNF